LKAVADGRREYRSVILRKYSVHRNQKKNDKIPNVSLAGTKDLNPTGSSGRKKTVSFLDKNHF